MDKNKLFQWGFLVSLALTFVIYFIFDSRNRKLKQIIERAKIEAITSKIMDLNQKAAQSEEEYLKAYDKYKTLVNMYPDIISRLGLQFGPKIQQ